MIIRKPRLEKMKKSTLRLWIKALESGDYQQGVGKLCYSDGHEDRYCCLGVLYDVAIDDDWVLADYWIADNDTWVPSGNPFGYQGGFLERDRKSLGITLDDQGELIALNDQMMMSFEEIAGVLREILENKD